MHLAIGVPWRSVPIIWTFGGIYWIESTGVGQRAEAPAGGFLRVSGVLTVSEYG